MRDLASNEWRGFIPASRSGLAKSLDAEAQFVETSWGSARPRPAGRQGRYLLRPERQRRSARWRWISPSPLFNNLFTLVARPGFRPATWDGAEPDPAVRIALEIGTSYDQVITEACPEGHAACASRPTTTQLARGAGRQGRLPGAGRPPGAVGPEAQRRHRRPGGAEGRCSPPRPTPALRREPDKTWRDYVDNWIDWNRGLGRLRRMVIDSLALVGITEADILPEAGL